MSKLFPAALRAANWPALCRYRSRQSILPLVTGSSDDVLQDIGGTVSSLPFDQFFASLYVLLLDRLPPRRSPITAGFIFMSSDACISFIFRKLVSSPRHAHACTRLID
jgi:hypothetical protein